MLVMMVIQIGIFIQTGELRKYREKARYIGSYNEFRCCRYDYKDDSNKRKEEIGFIAQDVEPYFPELVSENSDPNYDFKVKSLGYSTFGVVAIGALKELKIEKDNEIVSMNIKISQMEAEIAKMKLVNAEKDKKINELESLLKTIVEQIIND